MLGREPMNPRNGQYALGGRVHSWVRIEEPDTGTKRVLRRTFAGLSPGAYGRLGVDQWRACWPSTCVVVKDPFALVSLPTVVAITRCVPVVVYRSAVEVLASYRRMRWRPDTAESTALGARVPVDDDDAVDAMAAFWSWGYERALEDMASLPSALLVSHRELMTGGETARRQLLSLLDLDDSSRRSAPGLATRQATDERRLHNLDRNASDVMTQWRAYVSSEEQSHLDGLTAGLWDQLETHRAMLADT